MAGACLALAACGSRELAEVRYRLTFTVDVAGETKTASVVGKAILFHTGDANGKATTNTRTKGVAAVMDLGPHGTLVAALKGDFNEWSGRKKAYDLKCNRPVTPDTMILALVGSLTALSEQMRAVNNAALPAFLWFPANKSYDVGVQLCPEEFARVIGAPIKLVSVKIGAAPDLPAPEKFDVRARWFDDIRAEQQAKKLSNQAYKRLEQVEAQW